MRKIQKPLALSPELDGPGQRGALRLGEGREAEGVGTVALVGVDARDGLRARVHI